MDFTDTKKTMREKLGLSELSRPARIALAIVAVMVAVFAGKLIVEAATASTLTFQKNEALAASYDEEGASETDGAEHAGQSSATQTASIVVHVVGAVNAPGVYEVSEGSRISDAVDAAGGLREDANGGAINLARKLSDGEQISVPSVSDQVAGVAPEETPAVESAAVGSASSGKVDINHASSDELQTLQGIGEALAQRIIADRESQGPFASIEDLTRVSGIGQKKYEAIADSIVAG